MKILVKKLHDDSQIPIFGSEFAAGADLYAYINGTGHVAINPGQIVKIGTGIAAAIPPGYWGGIYARSGLAVKNGLRPANCVGVDDADYRGEIIVALYNDSDQQQIVYHGDRVAQLVITPVPKVTYEVADSLDDTDRGDGGFGHTGV